MHITQKIPQISRLQNFLQHLESSPLSGFITKLEIFINLHSIKEIPKHKILNIFLKKNLIFLQNLEKSKMTNRKTCIASSPVLFMGEILTWTDKEVTYFLFFHVKYSTSFLCLLSLLAVDWVCNKCAQHS